MAFCHRWRGRWHFRELWSSQYCCEMIELADSQAWSANSILSCAESVREVHSVLPFDFPIKSGSWIYFINVGIHLLMCSRKLCCVPDFCNFCSWKRNFGVGMYWKRWFFFLHGVFHRWTTSTTRSSATWWSCPTKAFWPSWMRPVSMWAGSQIRSVSLMFVGSKPWTCTRLWICVVICVLGKYRGYHFHPR